MRTDILIASYHRDIPYLKYNLQSITRFARGFGGVTIIIPEDEEDQFRPLQQDHPFSVWTYNRDSDQSKWQIHAQAMKCLADVACPDADFILHTDSDCIFSEPVTPDEYIKDGKPIMLYQSYRTMPADCPWKAPTEKALGIQVEYEFMRRHPQVNPRGVYTDLRGHISIEHGMPLERYVLGQKATFPWGFSEHNTIGAYAFYSDDWNDKYHWWNLDEIPAPRSKLVQFWSHSPPEDIQDSPTGGPRRPPIEVIREILK